MLLPATYPKTLPKLTPEYGEGIPQQIRLDVETMLCTKPRVLRGSEMIFEIATSIQDILEGVPLPKTEDVPTLAEERLLQGTATQQKAQAAEEAKIQEQKQVEDEAERALMQLVEQNQTRLAKRKSKPAILVEELHSEIQVAETLVFDQAASVEVHRGSVISVRSVKQKTPYRKGPVTETFTVQPVGFQENVAPFLILKECFVPRSIVGDSVKRQIQNLESRLDSLRQLDVHPNIVRPLNFTIHQSHDPNSENSTGWMISILVHLMSKGSIGDLMDTVGSFNVSCIRAWAIQLLEGLDFLHRHGITHGAIHLQNLLLEKDENSITIVKLSDCCYQQHLHALDGRVTSGFPAAASAYWTAPEISTVEVKDIPVTDIWNLGIVLSQMLFGLDVQRKYQSPSEMISSLPIPASLSGMLRQMFKSDIKKRPSAFGLLPSDFLRNDDPIYLYDGLGVPTQNPSILLTGRTMTTKSQRPRQDSTYGGLSNTSRYLNDFVEAGRLGRGGFGEVLRARNKLDGRFYAIKRITQSSASALSAVLSEIILLSRLNHPYVVRYFTAWIEHEAIGSTNNVSENSFFDESISDSVDGGSNIIFGNSKGGLDFISSGRPQIEFDYNSSTDDDDDDTFSEVITDEDDESGFELKPTSNKQLRSQSNDHARDSRKMSQTTKATTTSLYIQMEYCERKVSQPRLCGTNTQC